MTVHVSGTGSYMEMGVIYRCVDCHSYHVPDDPCFEGDDPLLTGYRALETREYFRKVACDNIIGLHDDPFSSEVERDAARWRYMQQPGFFRTGPYSTAGDWSGYSVGVRPTRECNLNHYIAGEGKTLQEAIDMALDGQPKEQREHYHTELIKRTILEAHLRITKGLGMSQAVRVAADEIITLFDPTHKKMEPFCNCPTGSHDDAYRSGGPLSGMPRPLCLLHNPRPR